MRTKLLSIAPEDSHFHTRRCENNQFRWLWKSKKKYARSSGRHVRLKK
jgi:hypothetical protein